MKHFYEAQHQHKNHSHPSESSVHVWHYLIWLYILSGRFSKWNFMSLSKWCMTTFEAYPNKGESHLVFGFILLVKTKQTNIQTFTVNMTLKILVNRIFPSDQYMSVHNLWSTWKKDVNCYVPWLVIGYLPLYVDTRHNYPGFITLTIAHKKKHTLSSDLLTWN